MNIIEKNISEYTEGQYNKYGDKIKEIQSSLDHDLKDYKSISDKIVRLDSFIYLFRSKQYNSIS